MFSEEESLDRRKIAGQFLMLSCGVAVLSRDPAPSHDLGMLSSLLRRLASSKTASVSSASAAAPAAVDVADWHGAIDVVIAAPVEKVWAIASDWLRFPRRSSVECVEGENGVPGCVRKVRAYDSHFWVVEKLTRIDHTTRALSYALVGSNSGLEVGYKGSFQAVAEEHNKTRVVWPFKFSPEQVNVDWWTAVVKTKVKAHIKELEELAQNSELD